MLSFVVGVISLAALAGWAGRWWSVFELACHFRAQYLWSLSAGALLFALAGAWKRAVAAGLLAAVHVVLIWPLYVSPDGTPPTAARLRILSLNLNSQNLREADVLAFVRQTAPDVAVFLEVNDRWSRALQALTDEWPYYCGRPQPGNFGIALYSKLPLENPRSEFLAESIPIILATVQARDPAGERPVTIFGIHPIPPMLSRGSASRERQFDVLAGLVQAEQGGRVVVGDFNATSWSPIFSDFIAATGLRDSRPGWGVQPSWPSSLPLPLRIPIDHCLISTDLQIAGRWIGPDVGSDHLPVIVDLAYPPLRPGAAGADR